MLVARDALGRASSVMEVVSTPCSWLVARVALGRASSVMEVLVVVVVVVEVVVVVMVVVVVVLKGVSEAFSGEVRCD